MKVGSVGPRKQKVPPELERWESTIVAGMLAGADSIDDLGIVRHGGMCSLFGGVYAPSTLGSFMRGFTHGHVRQLQAAARDTLIGLARRAPILAGADGVVY